MMALLYALHFMVCFVLIAVVLLQRGKGADLGASLGGGGANTVFGSRGAGNFLTKLTTGSAVLFMVTSLSLAYLGTQQADVQLFDESEPQSESPLGEVLPNEGAEVPTADGATQGSGALEEIDPSETGDGPN